MPRITKSPSCSFAPNHHCRLRFCAGVFLALAWLALGAAQAQTTNYALGTAALLEGPAAGTDSVVLGVTPTNGAWTASTNAAWLHLSLANQSGVGSTNVIFSYDANPGTTRSGTLTIAGQTLTVTQAGSTYIPAGPVTTLVSSGLNDPTSVAVDRAGNVYIANFGNSTISEWTAANNTVTTLVSSGLSSPLGVAVDRSGNVYIDDYGDDAIKEWMAATSNVITLVSSGLSHPYGVAVDGSGNVYIADFANSAIKEWTAANSNVVTLVSETAEALAVDTAGNVYFTAYNSLMKWTAANSNVSTLVSSGLSGPSGVAVDGSGNVYIANGRATNAILKWTAANGSVTTLLSYASNLSGGELNNGVAVDGAGNVYIAGPYIYNDTLIELPHAFVDPSDRLESLAAGSDALPAVLPATENLLGRFAPTSDQSWLTITGITNDVINVAFTASTSNRTGYIAVLGQKIPVTQGAPNYSLGTSALLEGPATGIESVVLGVTPPNGAWTATANTNWLHLSLANQSGPGSTNVVFSFDSNPGPTRSGTLTIAGQTLTVTQAGATYVAAGTLTTLVSSNLTTPLNEPYSVAVDDAGNVYIADIGNNTITEWMASNNTVTTLVSSGLYGPYGVAVDGAGNVYIADTDHGAIKEWTAANNAVTALVSSGLSSPFSVAVDGAGNVYIADSGHDAIKEWTAANSNVTTLVSSGLSDPDGVAVDIAGNVYIVGGGNNALKEWTAAAGTVSTLVSSALYPEGVAVDGAGNVYIASGVIYEWTAANGILTTFVSGLGALGVAVDSAGNVYLADTGNSAIEEVPRAFVDPTPKLEGLAAGNDVLPMVLPATENLLPPFAPTSDQAWLTITGVTNDVVSFSFTANTGPARTAHISLLGQSIAITQGLIGTPPTLTGAQMLGNGVLQFAFTNIAGASFTVLTTTNLSLPLSNWTVIGTATNTAPEVFQFTTQPATNETQLFYGVRSP